MSIKHLFISAAVLALISAVQQMDAEGFQETAIYDYDEIEDRDEICLCNKLFSSGPKIILVNLDDHCTLEDFEEFGIFIETGDMVFITGRELAAAG